MRDPSLSLLLCAAISWLGGCSGPEAASPTTPAASAAAPSASAAPPSASAAPPSASATSVIPQATATATAELTPGDRVRGEPVSCNDSIGYSGTELKPWPERALPDLRRDLVEPGGFNTSGIVVRHFIPVGCPKGAMCKPQPNAYLQLGEKLKDPEHTLTLETGAPKSHPIGTKLKVSVVLCDKRSFSSGTVNHGLLVAARR